MTKFSVENLVIGSGLMGSGVALELAKRGKSSLLVDQDPEIMNRASLRNEGKIHLGLIYAADKSLRTGIDQLSGALSFFRILESWVGDKIDEVEISSPFIYLVAKDSLLKGDELASYYRSLQEYFDDQFKKKNLNSYLGKKLDHLYKRLSLQSVNHLFETRGIESVFQTSERAINTDHLKKVISAAIQSDPAIEWCGNTKVINIESHENSYLITCFKKDTNEEIKILAKKVFNASWDQRLKLDSTLGIKPIDGWLHRLKYRVLEIGRAHV
jgi:L-2-hydroxyglutarate oxidase LhgO